MFCKFQFEQQISDWIYEVNDFTPGESAPILSEPITGAAFQSDLMGLRTVQPKEGEAATKCLAGSDA